MTAFAQGMAGLALVMGLALLCIRQVRAGVVLLVVQCAAVAASALVLHQPALAAPPLLLAAALRFAPPSPESVAEPIGGPRAGIAAAAVIAVLCQSQGSLGLPLAVMLLSGLLAATRWHPLMHVIALVGVQNGMVLAAGLLSEPPPLLPLACLLLPLPLAAGLLFPPLPAGGGRGWMGWLDLGLAAIVLVGSVVLPLDPTGAMFAPLLALDGVIRSWQRRRRIRLSAAGRGLALLSSLLLVAAVGMPNPLAGWLAAVAGVGVLLTPTLARRWGDGLLALLGAGVALFGYLVPEPSVLGYFSVFAGFTAIAAVAPESAVVLVILVLRLANRGAWPVAGQAAGIGIAVLALLTCAALLRGRAGRQAVPLLQQGQAAVAAVALCLGTEDGRFAGLVLLILLILSRTAARVTEPGFSGRVALAALAGVAPVGVFPGVVLVLLAVAGQHAWLLLPLGVAWLQFLRAGLPASGAPAVIPGGWGGLRLAAVPSVGWVPLVLALVVGYFSPAGLVRWWQVLTAGHE